MQKLLSLLLMSIIIIGISSCKKKTTPGTTTNNDLKVPITQEGIQTLDSIPPIPLPGTWPIEWTDTLDSQVDATLTANGVSKSQIKSAYAKGMVVDILGSAQTFDFIDDSVKIYVDKVGGTNPILIASKFGIPANATSITFDVISSDIKEFFISDLRKMTLKFNLKPNKSIMSNTKVHYKMDFEVTYTP